MNTSHLTTHIHTHTHTLMHVTQYARVPYNVDWSYLTNQHLCSILTHVKLHNSLILRLSESHMLVCGLVLQIW